VSPTVYSLLADGTAFFHGIVTAFILSSFVFGVLLRRKLPNWYQVPLFITALIALFFLFTGQSCPLTSLENHFRSLADQDIYQGSFLVYYIQELGGPELNAAIVSRLDLIIGIVFGLILLNFITRKIDRSAKSFFA